MNKLFLLLAFLPLIATAQNFHFSPRVGLIGYKGDLKPKISLSQTKLMGSIGARYDVTEHLTARSYFTYGSLKGYDSKGTAMMKERNLSFETKLLDFELGAQYNILSLNNHWWTPYVFAGVGLFRYNPYAYDVSNERVYLKPLSTEGQGFVSGMNDYKLTQLSVPFGFGVDYALGEDHRIGLEFSYRKLFTDYLDDVSNVYVDEGSLQSGRGSKAVELAYRGDEVASGSYPPAGTIRGNADDKDGYYYVAFTYTFRFWFDKYKYTSSIPGGKREKRVGCPSTRF